MRGCREYRVHAAPAVSCAKCAKESAHEHTGSAEALRHSLGDGFTAYRELSPENRALLSRTPYGIWHVGPVRLSHLRKTWRQPLSRQDHTTSPCASAPFGL